MARYISSIIFALVTSLSFGDEVILESSTSLDLADVTKLLSRVEKLVDSGIDVEVLYDFTASTPVDVERAKNLSVMYRGHKYKLVYQVYMDGIDSPSIYWLAASPGLIGEIDHQTEVLFEQFGN